MHKNSKKQAMQPSHL